MKYFLSASMGAKKSIPFIMSVFSLVWRTVGYWNKISDTDFSQQSNVEEYDQ